MSDAHKRFSQYNIEDLHHHLQQFQLSHGLALLGNLSADFWKRQETWRYFNNEAFSEWQLSFLAQELIRVGSDVAPHQLDRHAIVQAMRLANGLRDYFQLHDRDTTEKRLDLRRSFMYRTANEQFGPQTGRRYLIPRHVSVYEILARTIPRPEEPDLGAEFETACGLTILDFVKIGFAIMSLVTAAKKPNFVLGNLTGSKVTTLRDVLTREKLESFLEATALSVDAFRAKLAEEGTPPRGLEKHWFNPLWRYPIVSTSSGYIVPSVWLLVQRFTSGIYFDFLERRLGNQQAIREFTSLFGRIFEAHVGEELACTFHPGELFPEHQYMRGAWAGPDWTIVEGRKATLMECKTSRLTKLERERAEISVIRKRLQQDIIPAIRLFPTKAEHIRHRVNGLDNWPEIDDFEFVVVTLDPWWPELLTKEIIAEELGADSAENIRYHLVWVEQLEHLGCFREKTTIFDLLRQRWNVEADCDTRTYLFEEAKRLGIKAGSPRLDRLAEEFFRGIVS